MPLTSIQAFSFIANYSVTSFLIEALKKGTSHFDPFFHQSKKTSQSYLDSRYVKNPPFDKFFSGEKAQILHTLGRSISNKHTDGSVQIPCFQTLNIPLFLKDIGYPQTPNTNPEHQPDPITTQSPGSMNFGFQMIFYPPKKRCTLQ